MFTYTVLIVDGKLRIIQRKADTGEIYQIAESESAQQLYIVFAYSFGATREQRAQVRADIRRLLKQRAANQVLHSIIFGKD